MRLVHLVSMVFISNSAQQQDPCPTTTDASLTCDSFINSIRDQHPIGLKEMAVSNTNCMVLVSFPATWAEAQSICRNVSSRLAWIALPNGTQNHELINELHGEVINPSENNGTWVGLTKEKENRTLYWDCPYNKGLNLTNGQYPTLNSRKTCGYLLSKHNSHDVMNNPTCSDKLNFYCELVVGLPTTSASSSSTSSRQGSSSQEKSSPANPSPVNPSPVNPSPVNPSPESPSPVNPSPENPSPESPSSVNPSPENPSPEKATDRSTVYATQTPGSGGAGSGGAGSGLPLVILFTVVGCILIVVAVFHCIHFFKTKQEQVDQMEPHLMTTETSPCENVNTDCENVKIDSPVSASPTNLTTPIEYDPEPFDNNSNSEDPSVTAPIEEEEGEGEEEEEE